MQADGQGWLFVPQGLEDGPLPTHYEPHESPFDNALYSQRANPRRQRFKDLAEDPYNPVGNEGGADLYPYVLTTYRLTEHHCAGGFTRFTPYLSELQPGMFVEVHPDLARERGLRHGDWATIVTARSAIEARVMVTDRMRPVRVNGRVHTRSASRTTGARAASRPADPPTTSRTWRSTRTCTSRRSRR